MRSKRIAALLLAALTALALCGCGNDKAEKTESADMTIRPVDFTQEEAALTELLGLEMGNYRIYDFQLGENSGVQSLRLTAYELADNGWRDIAMEVQPVSEAGGRVALTFGRMTDGVKTAVQSASGTSSNFFTPVPEDDVSAMACATSMLTSSAAIVADQEIPLAIQIVTAKGQINSYDVQYFGMPREYAKHGYEHVYAITVMFSQKPSDELVRAAAPGIPQEPSAEPSPEA